MALAFGIQALTARRDTSERRFAIVDRTGVLGPAIVEAARRTTPRRHRRPAGARGPRSCRRSRRRTAARTTATRLALSDRVRRGELFAFVEIPAEVLDGLAATTNRACSTTPVPDVPGPARLVASRGEPGRRGPSPVDPRRRPGRDAAPARAGARWTARDWSCGRPTARSPTAEKVDAVRAFAMPAITMFMLFGLVMSSAPQLLNSVIEEKTSRISEVLLGSVSAFHLMLGKLLGSVAVTMVLAVIYIGGGLLIAAQADYFGLIRWSLHPVVRDVPRDRRLPLRRDVHRHRRGVQRGQGRAGDDDAGDDPGDVPDLPLAAGGPEPRQRRCRWGSRCSRSRRRT